MHIIRVPEEAETAGWRRGRMDTGGAADAALPSGAGRRHKARYERGRPVSDVRKLFSTSGYRMEV